MWARIARGSTNSHRGAVTVNRWRRPWVVWIRHVSLSWDTAVRVLRWHPIVLLRCAVGHIARIHRRIHLLVVLRRVLRNMWWRAAMCVPMYMRRGSSSPRPRMAVMSRHMAYNRRGSTGYVDSSRRHSRSSCTLCQLHVLPSRQMAVTHPAGLGFSFNDGCRPAGGATPVCSQLRIGDSFRHKLAVPIMESGDALSPWNGQSCFAGRALRGEDRGRSRGFVATGFIAE